MPLVSVIVNCFNEAKFVREALDSVFAQTFQDWEVIFWDNASTDESTEIAATYGDRVRCFRSDSMVPLGTARKLAFEQTQGDFFAILDADDVWLPEKLERQVELFNADADLGMTYCDAVYFDGVENRNRLFKLTNPHRGRVFGNLLARNFIFSSTMMFRRSVLEKVGGAFDDKFSRAQDYDLTLRVAYHCPIDYVDEPLLKWRINGPADKPWKKSLVAREEEVKSSIESLIDSYPDINSKYELELKSLYQNIDYAFAVNAWRDGKRSLARSYLSKHLQNKKFAFVYMCTFFISFDVFYKVRLAYRDLTSSP